MRHRVKGKILGRKKEARLALLRGLAVELIIHEKIKTTLAKAKTLRPVVEKLITIGKDNSLNNFRQIYSFLQNRQATKKILENLGPRYRERRGGYTRIVKIGRRQGDAAEMAVIELV